LKPRTIIIGVDGATFDLLDPLMKAGWLPTFERLIRDGAAGALDSWPNSNSAAAWTSMVTGYNPGQHAVYDFGDAPPQRGQVWHPTTGRDRRKDPFWLTLTAAGQTAGVINVPISYPADPIGFMLAGMDTPGLDSKGFTHPPELYTELRRQGINYVIDTEKLSEAARRDPFAFPPQVRNMVEARARATLYLMDTRPWDVVMSVFTATDRMQHSFWPASIEALVAQQAHPLRSLYQQIDAFLVQILERVDERTTLLIVSDHGFGPMQQAPRGVNRLFSRTGLLAYRSSDEGRRKSWFDHLVAWGRRTIPDRHQRNLAMLLPRLRRRVMNDRKFKGIDWSRTKAFFEGSSCRVWINLEGRQPEGIVPQAEYAEVCRQVRELLLGITDPDSGRRLVRSVRPRDEVYSGPHVGRGADLLVDWDYGAMRDAVRCMHEGKAIDLKPEGEKGAGDAWLGNHRPLGILLAYGAGVKAGTRIEGARIMDIAPTVLHRQGLPIPADMDGRVLTGLFAPGADGVAHASPAAATKAPEQPEIDEAERLQIEQRLRDLGYID
jgi:predicted AlkP superfamily phosphohydrolase/phosphomutase